LKILVDYFFPHDLKALGWVPIQIDGQGRLDINGAEFNKCFYLGNHDNPSSERLAMLGNKHFSGCLEDNWKCWNKKLAKLLDFSKKCSRGIAMDIKKYSRAAGGIGVLIRVGERLAGPACRECGWRSGHPVDL
jgi:hypothetical protein